MPSNGSTDSAYTAEQTTPAVLPNLRVLIIGAGVGGVSTALALAQHGIKSTVFESASKLAEVGAGINLCPNLARVLERLGVVEHAKSRAVAIEQAIIIRSKTDETLSAVDFEDIAQQYKHPFYTVFRADLQAALLSGCEDSQLVTFHLGQSIAEIDFAKTRIRARAAKNPEDPGKWYEGDVIIAADGVKSITRKEMLALSGEEDDVVDTGQAAYRIMVKREQMMDDEELRPMIEGKTSYRWIGHQRHIIAYPIAGNEIFNISTAHPDVHFADAPTEAYTTRGAKSELLETYHDFCPRVQKLLNLVPEGEVCEWKLRVHHPLPSWVEQNVALCGDACHPTVPHLAQGAAQAAEDAAVLGAILPRLKRKEDIHRGLVMYQLARKERADRCVAEAAANGKGLQISDGADQEARDKAFAESAKSGGKTANPDKAVDKETQKWLYAFDCVKDVLDKWDDYWEQAGALVQSSSRRI